MSANRSTYVGKLSLEHYILMDPLLYTFWVHHCLWYHNVVPSRARDAHRSTRRRPRSTCCRTGRAPRHAQQCRADHHPRDCDAHRWCAAIVAALVRYVMHVHLAVLLPCRRVLPLSAFSSALRCEARHFHVLLLPFSRQLPEASASFRGRWSRTCMRLNCGACQLDFAPLLGLTLLVVQGQSRRGR